MSENQANTKVDKKEEQTSKKRDIIKNIAIIFLAVMLVLTFFSNTIMNYSLPQVSTEQISGGSIKNQVRGKGIIEVVDPYSVIVEETRTISSVRVQEGDYVSEGDVIYTLKGEESEELEEAKKALETAEKKYKTGLLDGTISPQANGVEVDLNTLKSTLASFDATIAAAEKEIETRNNNIENLTLQISAAEDNKTLLDLDRKLENAKGKKDLAEAKKKYAEETTIPTNEDIRDAAVIIKDANQNLEDEYQAAIAAATEPTEEQLKGHEAYVKAEKDIEAANKAIDNANKDIQKYTKEYADAELEIAELNAKIGEETKKGSINTADLRIAKNSEETLKLAAEKRKADAEAKKKAYVSEMSGKVEAAAIIEEIAEAQEKVSKLEQKALGGEITAPVSGTIMSVPKVSGEKTEPKETVATIRVDGKGFQTKLSVDAKLAKTVKVGDEVIIDDYWYYGVTANLVSIQPDKADPKNKRELTFELEGEDLAEGGSISLAVGDSNSRYDLTIPKSALGHDNKGDFILILVPKQVPFGTRYIAKRVEVTTVYATDDTRAAIEAEVDAWGTYVITNSTRPINSGEQVRLAEENK